MDGITKGGNLLEEPALTSCSLLARAQLLAHAVPTKDPPPGDTVSERCWTMMSGAVCDIISSRCFETPEDKPFEMLSTYLRVCTNYATILVMMMLEPFTIRTKAMTAVAERISSVETIDLSQLPPVIRYWVRDFQRTSYDTYGPDGNGLGRFTLIGG